MANKTYAYTDADVWNLFSNYDETREVAEYITKKYPSFFSKKDAIMHATRLLNDSNYTKAEVLSGKADETIDLIYKAEVYLAQSIRNNEENKVPLKPVKQHKPIITFKRALTFGLAVAAVTIVGKEIKNTNKKNEEYVNISQNIGMLTSLPDSEDYLHKRDIVAQNTYSLGNGNYAYNTNQMALDILEFSKGNNDLFSLALYDTYYNMNYDKLRNIDDVFLALKINTPSESANEGLNNSNYFVEYVLNDIVNQGLVKKDSKEYQRLLEAVESYKMVKLKVDASSAVYGKLNDSDQLAINDLVDFVNELRSILGDKYKDTIDKMVEGTRGR